MPGIGNRRVQVRLSENERAMWQAAADRSGLAMSEMVREAVAVWMHRRIVRGNEVTGSCAICDGFTPHHVCAPCGQEWCTCGHPSDNAHDWLCRVWRIAAYSGDDARKAGG